MLNFQMQLSTNRVQYAWYGYLKDFHEFGVKMWILMIQPVQQIDTSGGKKMIIKLEGTEKGKKERGKRKEGEPYSQNAI